MPAAHMTEGERGLVTRVPGHRDAAWELPYSLSRLPKHSQFVSNQIRINLEISKCSAGRNYLSLSSSTAYYKPLSQGWESRHITVIHVIIFIFPWGQILTSYFTFYSHFFPSNKAWLLIKKIFWIAVLEHQPSQNKAECNIVFLSSHGWVMEISKTGSKAFWYRWRIPVTHRW